MIAHPQINVRVATHQKSHSTIIETGLLNFDYFC